VEKDIYRGELDGETFRDNFGYLPKILEKGLNNPHNDGYVNKDDAVSFQQNERSNKGPLSLENEFQYE
jgi:hypothetical protein